MSAPPAGITLRLADGTPVLVRPVYPGDRERLRRGIGEMSDLSRTMRFFTPADSVTEQQLDYFTRVDQRDHVAWCGVSPDAEQRGYGLARFIRDVTDPAVADFAIAVIDEMQGRGLGTILLAALYLSALELNIRELRGEVLLTNVAMNAWLPQLGATFAPAGEEDFRIAHWPIVSLDRFRTDTPSAQRLAMQVHRLAPLVRM